ncbi:MAG: NADH dehydrogenase [Gemmatimonadota bacterium]
MTATTRPPSAPTEICQQTAEEDRGRHHCGRAWRLPPTAATRILVLGAGYGGLTCALRLGRRLRGRIDAAEIEVVLVDRNPYHLLETRLHEAAARGVEVTIPVSKLISKRPVRFVQANVSGIDIRRHAVLTAGGAIDWDILVVALGSRSIDFGIPGIRQHAFELKTLDDARSLRGHLRARFSEADRETDPARRRWLRRIIVGGGGLTGVEAATELGERVRRLTRAKLGSRDGGEILMVEAAERLLPAHDPSIADKIADLVHRSGIRVLTGTRIDAVGAEHIRLSTGEVLRAGTVVWTGGVRASEILENSGLETSQQGRVTVDATLRLRHAADVFVIGDAALFVDPDTGDPVPMAAQFALQQGRLAADNIVARVNGTDERVYRPRVLGEVISLGRHLAVGWLALGWGGRLRMTGFLASLLKRAIGERHLASLWRESRRWTRPG